MDGKFIHGDGDGIAHCPYCRGVLLRDFQSRESSGGDVSFKTRCPHCEEAVSVSIKNGKIIVGQAVPDKPESQEGK